MTSSASSRWLVARAVTSLVGTMGWPLASNSEENPGGGSREISRIWAGSGTAAAAAAPEGVAAAAGPAPLAAGPAAAAAAGYMRPRDVSLQQGHKPSLIGINDTHNPWCSQKPLDGSNMLKDIWQRLRSTSE